MDCHVIGPLLATMTSSFRSLYIYFNHCEIVDDIYLTPKDNDIIKLPFNSLGPTPVRRLFTLGSLTNIAKFIENDIRNFVLQVVWLSRDSVMWSTKPIFTILSPLF